MHGWLASWLAGWFRLMGNRRSQDEEVNYVNDSNRVVGILKNRNVELLRISEASGNYLPEGKQKQ